MRKFNPVRRCKECDKPIRDPKRNKSGLCSNCLRVKSEEEIRKT